MAVTVRAFSAGELASFKSTQESAMMDTCAIYSPTDAGPSDLGLPQITWSLAFTSDCGFSFDPIQNNSETQDEGDVVAKTAKLRLPVPEKWDSGQGEILKGDFRVKITNRFGYTTRDDLWFYAVGQPAEGPSGLVINLELVGDESGP